MEAIDNYPNTQGLTDAEVHAIEEWCHETGTPLDDDAVAAWQAEMDDLAEAAGENLYEDRGY